ncbi:AAA family ATPase [Pseudomonas marginalis]|uniref:AAA family ATPase n=1 Tax=Pseudomonas marginalis TaxID=298 RepID=UPI002A36A11E|nr:AAA family ATPase [Pseudomonas marginalis]WPN23948.1 AAA family ATPase [Pseudomonas marginalis]
MLRITRPKTLPPFLHSPKVLDERRKILNYLRHNSTYRLERRDGLNEDLFFDSSFRDNLSYIFHDKCAFCETQLKDTGNILHLRPLRFGGEDDMGHDDYYLWLAFEWRNIFYACPSCIKAKAERFPVEGDRGDFLATFDSISKTERALLIDPTTEDPNKHLYYLTDGRIIPLTKKGLATVEVFHLNRGDLCSERREHIHYFLDMLCGQSRSNLWDIVDDKLPHSGALQSILRRILTLWRPNERPLRGRFLINQFALIWSSASHEDLGNLRKITTDLELGVNSPDHYQGELSEHSFQSLKMREWSNNAGDISKITISNFKAIKQLKIALPRGRSERAGAPALMILGENSVGKSSILAAIALAAIGTKEAKKFKKYFPEFIHSPTTKRFDQLDQIDVQVTVDFHFSGFDANFKYDSERAEAQGTIDPALKVLAYGPRRYFDTRKVKHKAGAAARVQTLFDPLATIPYPADWLRAQTGRRFHTIAAALRMVLALDDDDELIIEPDHLAVRANGRVTPIDALSEGYRSVFAMTVDIIRELLDEWDNLEQAQALVLIDELETHLHPRWKMQVMTSLRKVFPRVQFIVTTHDPLCLRGMDDDEVMVLQKDDQGRIHALENLPSVKGMTAEQLLTSDYFGLASTADPSTEIDLASLAGDVSRTSADGRIEARPSNATTELVNRLAIGDSPTEQVVQDALTRYLERRESERDVLLPRLREEAVSAVLKALTRDRT